MQSLTGGLPPIHLVLRIRVHLIRCSLFPAIINLDSFPLVS